MRNDLTPIEVVAWLREQQRKYGGMADSIEKDFDLKRASTTPSLPNMGTVTAGEIRGAVLVSGHRIGDLAKKFNTTDKIVTSIINSAGSGLYVGERGWVKASNGTEVSTE